MYATRGVSKTLMPPPFEHLRGKWTETTNNWYWSPRYITLSENTWSYPKLRESVSFNNDIEKKLTTILTDVKDHVLLSTYITWNPLTSVVLVYWHVIYPKYHQRFYVRDVYKLAKMWTTLIKKLICIPFEQVTF